MDDIQALLNERGRPLWAPFDQDTSTSLFCFARLEHGNIACCH